METTSPLLVIVLVVTIVLVIVPSLGASESR
jgi:hypothetical protein